MTHERTKAALQAYADGQVRWPRRWLIARHVARCPLCLAELEAIGALRTAVRTRLTVHRAPPGLAARIGSALPREAVARGGCAGVAGAAVGFRLDGAGGGCRWGGADVGGGAPGRA